MDQLKNKALQGLMYLGLGKGAAKFISFVNTLLLARLLTPEDYGLMAIVMVIVGFFGFFNEIGLGSAIKHRANISQDELNSVFLLSVLISASLYVCFYSFSPYLASYFGYSILNDMLRVAALSFIIGAIATVPDALVARDMRFKLYAGVDFAMILLQCILTLVLAWFGFKAWALVWGFIASQIFKTCSIFWFSQWRPSRIGDLRAARTLMNFGITVTYSRLTWYFYNNANTLIISKVLSAQQMGIFSMASTLTSLTTQYITSLVIQIAGPLFSRMQNDLGRLDNALRRLTTGIALMGFPIISGMGLTAAELVPVLLGDKWLEVVFTFQILCLLGIIKSVDPLITQAFISIGKPNITAKYTTLCAITIPLSVYIGALFGGLPGVALAMVITYPLSSLYLFYQARRTLHFSLRRYLRALQTPIEACLFMAGIVWLTQLVCYHYLPQQLLLTLILKTVAGIAAYCSYLVYVRQSGLRDCYEVLTELGVKPTTLQRWPFTRLKESL